jgi:hypothetical protein
VKRKRSVRSDRLKKEITELRKIAFGAPKHSPFSEAEYLEIERDSIVRARVLLDCAMVEEVTAIIIMDHVLDDSPKWNQVKYFGCTKKYHVLYDEVLGRLPARYKLAVVKKFIRIPKTISKTIQRMLGLRDVFAHVRTLDYSKRRNLGYKGKNILSEAGCQSYMQDSSDAVAFLVEKSGVLKAPTN